MSFSQQLAAGITAGLGEIEAAITQVAALMQGIVDIVSTTVQAILTLVTGLGPSARAAGLSFSQQLAAGITAGLGEIEAALAAVAALFPHSPAKAGPLKRPPDWASYLGFGLPGALGGIRGMLGGLLPTGPLTGGFGGGGAGSMRGPVTVNINNPVVRDEVDIRRLADAVGSVLTMQSSNERRLQAGWS